jgi:hypothetical protein
VVAAPFHELFWPYTMSLVVVTFGNTSVAYLPVAHGL